MAMRLTKLTAAILIALSGIACQSTTSALQSIDYGCVDIELDMPYTESSVLGRGIILPEGKELSQETIDSLCNY
jgi:hypothetical protein